MKKLVPLMTLSLLAAFAFCACETPGRATLASTATKSGAGTGSGKREEHRFQYDDDYYGSRSYYRHTRYRGSRYPVAQTTDHHGFVMSPYPPHNLICAWISTRRSGHGPICKPRVHHALRRSDSVSA